MQIRLADTSRAKTRKLFACPELNDRQIDTLRTCWLFLIPD